MAARTCHATALVAPPPGSRLWQLVAAALGPERDPAAGAVLCVFGGCGPTGRVLLENYMEVRSALRARCVLQPCLECLMTS